MSRYEEGGLTKGHEVVVGNEGQQAEVDREVAGGRGVSTCRGLFGQTFGQERGSSQGPGSRNYTPGGTGEIGRFQGFQEWV